MIATFDLAGDIYMLKGLLGTRHIFWTTLTVFQMISPFLVGLVPFITFQLKRYQKTKYRGYVQLKDLLLVFITATPLVVIYLQLMDIIFIFTQLIIRPFLHILRIFTGGRLTEEMIDDKILDVYSRLF